MHDIEALAERLWLEYRWADVIGSFALPVHTRRDTSTPPPSWSSTHEPRLS